MVFWARFLFLILCVLSSSAAKAAVCKVPPGTSSNLAIDQGRLCIDKDPTQPPDGQTVRFVGYGIVPITIDDRWRGDSDCNTDCDPEANTCSSSAIKRSFATLQLDLTNPKTGTNMTRTFAMGGSCNLAFSAENRICRGFSGRHELMPFERLADGRFNVQFANNSTPGVDGNLNRCWEARFRYYLKQAERNGLVVIVSLFDENTMTGTGPTSTWHKNPWNPTNNNMGNLLPTTRTGLPAFYNICPNMEALTSATGRCSDSSLNRLGQIQKKYVTRVVEAVRKSGARNVMFEVMNQARIEDGHVTGNHADAVVLAAWHNTIANWFPDFLWVAAVKKDQDRDMRTLLRECRSNADCKDSNPNVGNGNPLLVFWRNGIDVIKPHWAIWSGEDPTGDFCQLKQELFRFGKPVLIDDDGAPLSSTNDNRLLARWATDLCGRPHGSIHFYHTKDGTNLQGKEATVCEQPDSIYLDCNALDSLTNNVGEHYVGPTPLCGKIVNGIGCVPNGSYCNACHDRNTALDFWPQ